MIKGVSGIPGSGKTYYVVHEISQKYFTFNKQFSEWQINEKFKNLVIFTNIKNFKLNAIQIDEYCTENNITWEQLLTVDHIERYLQNNPDTKIIFLIDEAQKYFPTTYKNNEVFFFFQYHRHLGVDIFLTYQTWASINRKITDLQEFEIRAVRKSFKLGSEFRYLFYAGNDKIGGTVKKSDPMVFALYTSFDTTTEGTEKTPKYAIKMLIISITLTIVLAFLLKYLFTGLFVTEDIEEQQTEPPQQQTISQQQTLSSRTTTPRPTTVRTETIQSTFVNTGGVWLGNRLMSISFFGQLIPVSEYPFPYQADFKNRTVLTAVPDEILSQIDMPHIQLLKPTTTPKTEHTETGAPASETSDRARTVEGGRFRQST